MKKKTALLVIAILLLAGCGQQNAADHNHDQGSNPPSLQPVEVQISIQPEQAESGKPVTILATVTQGDEKVDDADEVVFEIWRDDEQQHEKLDGTPENNGVYSVSKTFEHPGLYNVIAHVTARDMHTMPLEKITVK